MVMEGKRPNSHIAHFMRWCASLEGSPKRYTIWASGRTRSWAA